MATIQFLVLSFVFSISLSSIDAFKTSKVVSINYADHMPMIDELGRERYFHGENVVYKQIPFVPILDRFHPILSFGHADIAIFKSLSWNIIRLGVMWPGVEPEKLQINETYMNEIDEILQRLNNAGIYALLDFHQDVLSEKVCGEGVPLWAAIPDGRQFPGRLETSAYQVDLDGVPNQSDCDRHAWQQYYFTEATSTGFQNLYDNKRGIQAAFASYWATVAKRFGHYPNVLGYNLINEPWAGDIITNPSLLLPGFADRINLQPMYETLNGAIRSVDNVSLVIFESVTWDNGIFGFTQSPGGDDYANRSVFGYHYYRPPRIGSLDLAMQFQVKKSQNLSCGAMMTEFDSGVDNDEIILSAQTADENLQSWIGWEYKPLANITGWSVGVVDPSGKINVDLAKNLSRPYASAVGGFVTIMKYSDAESHFLLRYLVDTSAQGPTEIFVSREYHYPSGFQVKITPDNFATYKSVADGVEITHTAEAVHNAILLIEIFP